MADTSTTTNNGAGAELMHDTHWKKIQQNTFTRWVNQQLKCAGSSINCLENDLCDGIRLIKLAEVLSGKRMTRYNKKPVMRTQKLDNISLVLRFFQDEESIKIVNIDSTHIVDHNLKLILGLIWTLILHYSISQYIPISTTNSENGGDLQVHEQQQQQPKSPATAAKDPTPKQRLLNWIRSHLPSDVPVTNFTSDWNDGIALGSLVESCVPGVCLDWRKWSPNEAIQNTLKSMKAAEDNLGIAALITPEELINPNVDEKSVMTYLAQFPRGKPQPSGRVSGIDAHPIIVGLRSQFFVDVARLGLQPEIQIFNPQDVEVPTDVEPNSIFPTRSNVTFTPEQLGKHKINLSIVDPEHDLRTTMDDVFFTAIPAPQLVGLPDDSNKGVEIDEQQKFRITNVPENCQLNVLVVDPRGKEIHLSAEERVGNASIFQYRPSVLGLHSINVFLNEKHIPGSPFPLRVINVVNDAKIWGRGICADGPCVGDELAINVDNCTAPVEIIVTTRAGLRVPVAEKKSPLPKEKKQSKRDSLLRQTFLYVPRSAGVFNVQVTCNDQHIAQSPYEINVRPRNTSAIRAVGPGLEGGIANQRAAFYVDSRGNTNLLEFSIEGPSKTDINCLDNGDGTAIVEYVPTTAGRYVINVLNNGAHIKDSPFIVMIEANNDEIEPISTNMDSSAYSTTNDGIQTAPEISISGFEAWNKSYVGDPFKFIVSKHSNDNKPIEAIVYDPDLKKVEDLSLNPTSTAYNYSFRPEKPGKHLVSLVKNNVAVAGWPFIVNVNNPLDLSKLRVFGPGVSSDVRTRQRTSFTIDSRQVGSNDIEVEILDFEGDAIPVDLDENRKSDGIVVASYNPDRPGTHRIKVLVEGIPTFDIKIDVFEVPPIALEDYLPKSVLQPNNNSATVPNQNSAEKSKITSLVYEPEEIVSIPLTTKIAAQPAPTSLIQNSTEIPQTVVGHDASLYLKLSDAKPHNNLVAHIHAPNQAPIENALVERLNNDQYRVNFRPKVEGMHSISVLDDGEHIDGSPFKVPVRLLGSHEAHRAWASGSGLESGRVGRRESFIVCAGGVGVGELSVTVDGPSRAQVVIRDEADGNCKVEYVVTEPGLYEIDVKFNDAHIAQSPFRVFVKPNSPLLEKPIESGGCLSSNRGTLISTSSPQPSEKPMIQPYSAPTKYVGFNGIKEEASTSDEPQQILEDSFKQKGSTTTEETFCNSSYTKENTVRMVENSNGDAANSNNTPLNNGGHNDYSNGDGVLLTTAYNGVDYSGDADKVLASGSGLNTFRRAQPARFDIDTANAGVNLLFVGVVTSQGPSDEVFVKHLGYGKFTVEYKIPHSSKALIFVKYGDKQIPGSPFVVLPRKD